MVCKHPPLPTKPGGPDNWIEATKPKGLPPMIDCVARAIYWDGKAKGPDGVSRAVRIATGKVEDWAQGRGGVKPDTIAKARAAVEILHAKQAQAKANNLTIPADEVVDLAMTKRKVMPRKDPLLSVDATVSRLRKRPELRNASDAELRRMAAARILRGQIRRKLGIADLKKLPKAQLQQLKNLGLVGSHRAPVGAVVSYTIQRGRRKGVTIQVRYGKSGRWSEVRPKAQTIPGAKR